MVSSAPMTPDCHSCTVVGQWTFAEANLMLCSWVPLHPKFRSQQPKALSSTSTCRIGPKVCCCILLQTCAVLRTKLRNTSIHYSHCPS